MKIPFDGLNLRVISPTYGVGQLTSCKCQTCYDPTKCLNCFPFIVEFKSTEIRLFDEYGTDFLNGETLKFCPVSFHKIWYFYR